jgi:hypothetical protein
MVGLLFWLQNHSILLTLPGFLLLFPLLYWPGRRTAMERNARIPLDDNR